MISSIYSIASASFREGYKKRLFHLVGILTLLYLLIFGQLIHYSVKSMVEESQSSILVFVNVSTIVALLGFYFSSMVVAFLTIMSSIGLVSSDIESGTIYAVITKPLKRSSYILGKYLGTAALLIIYSTFLYCTMIILPLTVNVSFFQTFGMSRLLLGLIFFIFEPLVILSLCILGSVTFKTLNNGIFIVCVYILGLIGGVLEQIGLIIKSDGLFKLGILSSLVSPFDSVYRKMMDSIFSSSGILSSSSGLGLFTGTQVVPSIWMTIYTLVYLIACVYLSIHSFKEKNI
ncbi:MAG: ABC transporter permease subunit [Bacillota bacterium]|nr:ABC transporter permease subunit [Bacillota bacterium]